MTNSARKWAISLVVLMAPAGALATAQAQTATPSPSPSLTESPTPTPSGAATGAISGRLYIDVNANGTFDAPDVPKAYPLALNPASHNGPTTYTTSAADGTYSFAGLSPASYTVGIALAFTQGCVSGPGFTWAGEVQGPFSCATSTKLSSGPQPIDLAPGGSASLDFVGKPINQIAGSIWVNAEAAPLDTPVAAAVSAHACWQGSLTRATSETGLTVSHYLITLAPFTDPACIGGDISVLLQGKQLGPSIPWAQFWDRALYAEFAEPPFNPFQELENPPFEGFAGTVLNQLGGPPRPAGSPIDDVPDGTVIRAYVGKKECGRATTKALSTPYSPVGNLFGLIVPPGSVSERMRQRRDAGGLLRGQQAGRSRGYGRLDQGYRV